MDRVTVALIIQEGSKILSEVIRNRHALFPSEPAAKAPPQPALEPAPEPAPATPLAHKENIATGCIPCSIGHLGTCSGLLSEAMRFARKDGMSDDVISRVNICLDELNALEREDLRPEVIHPLPGWEKELATETLNLSRSLRHDLEGLVSVDELEAIAAKSQTGRQTIGKTWFKERLKRLSPEQQQMVREKLEERVKLQEAQKVAADEAAKTVEEQWRSQPKN